MEKFKAVEKEMKTKAYSKEGLSLATKIDPKDRERLDMVEFLQHMNEELEQQVEKIEADVEIMHAGMKKGKKSDNSKAERIAELEEIAERHKWHQGKLDLLQRALENSNVDTEQVKEIEDSIKYYVEENQSPDFMEDDTIYDDFNLDEEEAIYGMGNEADRVSSQDTQSIADEPELEARPTVTKAKSGEAAGARRSSTQLKSPLPVLATLHTPLPGASNTAASSMKPAPIPTRTPGEPLKYASAAAAAAASDKNGVGIAPLPPPPGLTSNLAPGRSSATASPAITNAQPASRAQIPAEAPTPAQAQLSKSPAATPSVPATPAAEKQGLSRAASAEDTKAASRKKTPVPEPAAEEEDESQTTTPPLTNGESHVDEEEEESVYHLPSSLQDLLDSFEATKNDISAGTTKPPDERMLVASMATAPDSADTDAPRHYRPQNPYPFTPAHYPQEPLPIFDDPRLYSRIETDALFYAFYYRQNTYQQYLAAKALKSQSWRFHKQYQTWFQRHEEPKAITEDYEQGTYRFFDYESTWSVPPGMDGKRAMLNESANFET
jgi:CCR4-NOT transcription complex subunit 3